MYLLKMGIMVNNTIIPKIPAEPVSSHNKKPIIIVSNGVNHRELTKGDA